MFLIWHVQYLLENNRDKNITQNMNVVEYEG